MAQERKQTTLEDVVLIFKNFAGAEGQYNTAGDRNFAVLLDPDTAAQLATDGWNVRTLEAKEEGEDDAFYLPVTASYKNQPPRIVMITSRGKENIGEDLVDVLDYAQMATVDLICNGYDWSVNGKSGTKAYLKSMFVTIEEDFLERKYANL